MERAELIGWLSRFDCAESQGGFYFLRDPHWSVTEYEAAAAQMRTAATLPPPERGWVCVRTGGSGGGVKFARHDEHTLSAAIAGFTAHFGFSRVDTVGVLPAWHVSGLMARLRCFATGGKYIDAAWKDLVGGQLPTPPSRAGTVLSLVPTQLQRLLAIPAGAEWLRRFRIVFLGGGPAWPELAEAAARAEIPISLSYGMTETAAMIVAQRPGQFAAGDRTCGTAMPHARVRIDDAGRVIVDAPSLFRGYFPDIREPAEFTTPDLGDIDARGCLRVFGRVDGAIITGGKKVLAADVEAALRASGEFEDIAVLGLPHAEWGEEVVACYPAAPHQPDVEHAVKKLAPHQRPKRFVPLPEWPRNAQGKINRAELIQRLAR